MTHDQFIGEVQSRARLASRGEAERAVRATLSTLAERLAGGEADDLAAQLPAEIAEHLRGHEGEEFERMSLQDFYRKVSEREGREASQAAFHAKAVLSVLREAVSRGEFEDIEQQLPPEFDELLKA